MGVSGGKHGRPGAADDDGERGHSYSPSGGRERRAAETPAAPSLDAAAGRQAVTRATGGSTAAQQPSPRSLRAEAQPYVPSPKAQQRSSSPLRAGAAPFRGGQQRSASPPLRADAKPYSSPRAAAAGGKERSASPLRADAKPYSSPRHRKPPQQPGQETWVDLTQSQLQQSAPPLNVSAPAFKPQPRGLRPGANAFVPQSSPQQDQQNSVVKVQVVVPRSPPGSGYSNASAPLTASWGQEAYSSGGTITHPAQALSQSSPARLGGGGVDSAQIATRVAVLDDPAIAGVYQSAS